MTNNKNQETSNRDLTKNNLTTTEKLVQTAPGVNIAPVAVIYNIEGDTIKKFISCYLESGKTPISGIRSIVILIDDEGKKKPKVVLLLEKRLYTKNVNNQYGMGNIAPGLAKKLEGYQQTRVQLDVSPEVQKKISSISILVPDYNSKPRQDGKQPLTFKTSYSRSYPELICVELDIFKVLRHLLNARFGEYNLGITHTYRISNEEFIMNVVKSKEVGTKYRPTDNSNINYNKIAREFV